jgi:predicted Zn finger-like uncharacterized protein
MLIVCPNCATSYMLDPASLGAAGRTVRCTRCRTSWFAGGPEAPAEPVAVAETVTAEAETQPPRHARTETPPPPPEPVPTAAAPVPEAPEPAVAAAPTPQAAPVTAEPEPAPAMVAEAPPVELPATPQDEPAAEAVPVIVTDAPPLAPAEHEAQPHSADAESEAEVAATFDARRRVMQARRKKSRRLSRWTAVILVLVAFNVAVVGARNEVVRYLPQTASLFAAIGLPVNLRSLKFENVKLSTEDIGGITMLTVQGAIVSEAGKAVGVPRLRFAVRNATGQEVYTWTMAPPSSILEAGARAEFHSQIPVPKVDATDVLVRFLTPQDAGAK